MFIIADAHVDTASESADRFFEMLDALAQTRADVVFLGDIFDLWVALPRYEEPLQRRFADWCAREKTRRVVGFIEGNHEFYVSRRHRDCFTWSSERGHREDAFLMVHGDLINRRDHQYLWWRRVSKNPVMRTIVRWFPDGPARVHPLKEKMKLTNADFRLGLPHQALSRFARKADARGIRLVLVGHFHQPHVVREGQCRLEILPDWHREGWIGYLDRHDGRLETGPWAELISRHRSRENALTGR